METSFNSVYLIAVWWIVILMWQRRSLVAVKPIDVLQCSLSGLFSFWAWATSGTWGFRLVAFALGGLDTSVQVFGCELLIAPMGALATAITFTFFYISMLMIWKERFKKEYGVSGLIWVCPGSGEVFDHGLPGKQLELPRDSL